MGSFAHPVRISAQVEKRCPPTKLGEELALGASLGCGAEFAQRLIFARQDNADVSGLNSGTFGKKKISKCDRAGDSEWRVGVRVCLLDSLFQSVGRLQNAFAAKSGRLCAGD